jgi:3,4-dihydroxyphenylacetate 2,3-dioxygenase
VYRALPQRQRPPRLGHAPRGGRALRRHRRLFASGSLSHRFAQNGLAPEFAFKIWSPLLESLDHSVIDMWKRGEWKKFCEMLPEYAVKGTAKASCTILR